ncbi:MAG: metal-sensitive transcriptional regulator [Spirochaetota bacterium]|nr:MAG: metal-sensitive transcriptional regulator [Spirochaetota bacterium]
MGKSDVRRTHRSGKLKEDLLNRLSRIEGQVRGIERMVESDAYCDDILNQVTAVHSALSSVRNLLLENHIKSCVREGIEKKEYEIIDELMGTLKRMFR